jgi:hypothetical protein
VTVLAVSGLLASFAFFGLLESLSSWEMVVVWVLFTPGGLLLDWVLVKLLWWPLFISLRSYVIFLPLIS